MESRAKTDKVIKKLNAELKDRKKLVKGLIKHLKNITHLMHKGHLKK